MSQKGTLLRPSRLSSLYRLLWRDGYPWVIRCAEVYMGNPDRVLPMGNRLPMRGPPLRDLFKSRTGFFQLLFRGMGPKSISLTKRHFTMAAVTLVWPT